MSRYFNKLVELVDGYGYENMLLDLYNTPFEVKVHNDENRLDEAYKLRDIYGGPHDNPGNCFEVLIVLAKDVDDILWDSRHGDRTKEWFWMMMENMGLTEYTNPNYNEGRVAIAIDIFVNRKFAKNGSGGPFPLRRPLSNMRRIEWWYALNAYVNENFEYEFEDIQEVNDE